MRRLHLWCSIRWYLLVRCSNSWGKADSIPRFATSSSPLLPLNCVSVGKKSREPFRPWIPTAKDTAALEASITIPCQGQFLAPPHRLTHVNVIWISKVAEVFWTLVRLASWMSSSNALRITLSSGIISWVTNTTANCAKLKTVHVARWTSSLLKCGYIIVIAAEKYWLTIPPQIYSYDTTPFGPVTFLATTWRASSELSGYAQQDAHEFFISTLNQIHITSRGSTNVSCNCVIHSTFAGQLQSDVKCERCGNVTSTVDPMLDISLELKGKGGEVVSGENTLAACLRRWVLIKLRSLSHLNLWADLRNLRSWDQKNTAAVNVGKPLM